MSTLLVCPFLGISEKTARVQFNIKKCGGPFKIYTMCGKEQEKG
jgi:hypothetical protein